MRLLAFQTDHAAADLGTAGLNQLRVRTAAVDQATRAILQHSGFCPDANEMVMELRRAN